jgi:hypothetical protein
MQGQTGLHTPAWSTTCSYTLWAPTLFSAHLPCPDVSMLLPLATTIAFVTSPPPIPLSTGKTAEASQLHFYTDRGVDHDGHCLLGKLSRPKHPSTESKLIHGRVQAAPLLQLVHNDTLAPFPNVPPQLATLNMTSPACSGDHCCNVSR